MRKSKAKTINFSNLDENNKNQFFDFLLKNNITFVEGQENYVAKVTIKRSPEAKKSPLAQRKSITNVSQKSIQSKSQKEVKTPTKKQQKAILTKKKSTPVKENQPCNSNRSKARSEKTLYKNKSTTKKDSSIKAIETAEFSITKNEQKNKKQKNTKEVKKVNNQIKKKINDEKEIFDLVTKYLKIFNLKIQGQRPIKWTSTQLLKVIEEIYDESFSKNTQILQTKNNIQKKNVSNIFIKSIKDYFLMKFRSEKLGNSNLINMLHSLSIYLQRYKQYQFKIPKNDHLRISLHMFEDFILQVYEPEDLLFFLFARSMLKKQFKAHNKIKQNDEEDIFLNIKQISKFLACIVGKDSELIQDYKNMILHQIDCEKITASEFLKVLVEDYRAKRLLCEEEVDGDQKGNILFKDPTLRKLQNSMNQLTFGEETQEKVEALNGFEDGLEFWECYDEDQQKFTDQVEEIITGKLKKKVRELVGIITAHDASNQYYSGESSSSKKELVRDTIEKLLVKKSLTLFSTILEMNKIKWFQELGIKDPSSSDIQFVEKLQINLRNMKRNPDAKGIGDFCKAILTVPQLTEALEKLLP